MQFRYAIFVGAMAALASLAVPALAKHPDTQKTGEPSTSSSCSARQKTVDGTWTQIPCQELGSGGQTQHKSATRSAGEQAR
jgi:hypothetical protein